MTRVQNAIQRIYEDADLRDELTDDEAAQMLKWAESELARLDASGTDDAAFEANVDTLLSLLKKMNRFAGRQGQLVAQANEQATGNIAALAVELGHPADAAQVAAAGTGDPSGTLTALIGLLSDVPTAQVTPVSPTATQPDSPTDIVSQVEQSGAPSIQTDTAQSEPPAVPPVTSQDDSDPSDAPAASTHTSFGDYIDEYDL